MKAKEKLWSVLYKDQAFKNFLWRNAMKILIALFFITVCFCGCSLVNNKLGLKDDNFAEELLEKQIENQTGWDVDLTPSTPEKNKRYG